MIIKKNEKSCESKGNSPVEVYKKINDVNYFIKIYFSKNGQSIIFKVMKENILTYYYYEKYNLSNLKENNKIFNSMNNLLDIFQNIKNNVDKYSLIMENDSSNSIKILLNNNSEMKSIFNLRKKILSKDKLNPILIEQIQENETRLKTIKKHSEKCGKTFNNQKVTIDDINGKIDTINDNLENIIKEINNIKEVIKNNNGNQKDSKENDKINKEEKKRKKPNKNKDIDNEKKDEKKYKNINKKKTLCQNIAFYEVLFALNIIIIIIISYLFSKIKNLEEIEKKEILKRNKMKKKYSFVNILESMGEEELRYIQHTFDTGEIVNYEEEKMNEDIKNEKDINKDIINKVRKNADKIDSSKKTLK